MQGDICAILRQLQRHRTADALGAASDQGDAAREGHLHFRRLFRHCG